MLFKASGGGPKSQPEGYIFTIPPRLAVGRSSQPTGVFLRARRCARENETLPFILLLMGGSTVGLLAYSSGQLLPWSLALALGVSAFVLYVRFAYVVEGKLHPRPGQLPSTFLRVVLPRFSAALLTLYVIAVWFKVFIYASYPWTPVLLFVALLGVSLALFVGKNIQWALR
ncbi:MAG: hypothetical protein O7H41_20195 [Planctomycetota bacterium]|nr:hypothetical protein [Planctomycetota bacterium]